MGVSGADTARGHKGHVPPPFHHAHAHYTVANYVAIIRACACERTHVMRDGTAVGMKRTAQSSIVTLFLPAYH